MEAIVKIVKWSAIIAVFSSAALALTAFILYILSIISLALNQSVIADIFAVIQIWLPFNIFPIVGWVFTASSLYLTYKLAVFIFDYFRQFLNV